MKRFDLAAFFLAFFTVAFLLLVFLAVHTQSTLNSAERENRELKAELHLQQERYKVLCNAAPKECLTVE